MLPSEMVPAERIDNALSCNFGNNIAGIDICYIYIIVAALSS